MIQRIQSIYLLLTTALMAVFLFLPIAQFDTTDGIYSFTAQGISTVEAVTTPVQDSAAAITQTSVFTPTWGVFVLGTVIAVLSFITIFLYKNRPTQARICMINAFFLVTFYIVIFLSGYTFREDLSASNISWTAYIVMPFVALILDILAYKLNFKFLFQKHSRIGSRALGDLLRSTGTNHVSTLFTTFRSHIDNVVGILYNVHIVFDDNNGMTSFDKLVKRFQKRVYIMKM